MSSLPKIDGVHIAPSDFPEYTWNADLIEYDGPLLSLVKGESGEDYLFVWLDSDEKKNRWALIPIDREALLAYLNVRKSLLSVFEDSVFLYVLDLGAKARKISRVRTHWSKLPDSYLPEQDSFLHESIATEAARKLAEERPSEYSLGLDGELYIDDIATIPRVYQQLYSFHYGVTHIARQAVREKLSQLSKNWRGGISAVNIFTGLAAVMPGIHRARLRELKYNSPGHIKLSLLPVLAKEIAKSVKRIESPSSYRATEDFYADVYRYFRDQKLSGFDDGRAASKDLTPSQSKRLQQYVEKFFDLMDWRAFANQFHQLDIDALGQMRILLAYYRRLRRLRGYVISGKLSLP